MLTVTTRIRGAEPAAEFDSESESDPPTASSESFQVRGTVKTTDPHK